MSIYVYRDHSAQCWVATLRNGPALRPSACGKTPEEAKAKLREVIAARAEFARTHPVPSHHGFAETRILAAIAVASALALVALLSGCSAREALREIRDNARFSVYAIDHPRHGRCREVSLTSSSATAGESGAVYAGLCSHSIDAGAAADAAVSE